MQPLGQQKSRHTTAEIKVRTVIELETSGIGIVIGVRTGGALVVAVRGGRWVERGPAVVLEILAGPEQPHTERRRILDDWLQCPRHEHWPGPWDDTSSAMTEAVPVTAGAVTAEYWVTQGRDIYEDVSVARPQVRVPDALKLQRDELLVAFQPLDLDQIPEVIEDGIRGVVWFKYESEDGGPVWLERGDRSEQLFRGRWVDRGVAVAYAREHGHDFRGDA